MTCVLYFFAEWKKGKREKRRRCACFFFTGHEVIKKKGGATHQWRAGPAEPLSSTVKMRKIFKIIRGIKRERGFFSERGIIVEKQK
jgi:hypothetical protein